MIIDIEEAVEEFRNFMEIPVYGKALYLKMREYKDAIAVNIEEFKNLKKLRSLVKKSEKKCQKSTSDLEFEIVKTRGIWIPVIQGKNDCEPSRIIPDQLVKFIVKEASKMDNKIIHRKNNLTIPGLDEMVFNLWFEKIQEDYIFGIIKKPQIQEETPYKSELVDMREELKNIEYEKMFEIFRLMFEDEDFRKEVFRAYQFWQKMFEPNLKVI